MHFADIRPLVEPWPDASAVLARRTAASAGRGPIVERLSITPITSKASLLSEPPRVRDIDTPLPRRDGSRHRRDGATHFSRWAGGGGNNKDH